MSYATISSLLRLAVAHSEHRPATMQALFDFASITVNQLKTEIRELPFNFHAK